AGLGLPVLGVVDDRGGDALQGLTRAVEHAAADQGGAARDDRVRRHAGLQRVVAGVQPLDEGGGRRGNRRVQRRRDGVVLLRRRRGRRRRAGRRRRRARTGGRWGRRRAATTTAATAVILPLVTGRRDVGGRGRRRGRGGLGVRRRCRLAVEEGAELGDDQVADRLGAADHHD